MASDPEVGYGDEVAYSPIPRWNHLRSRASQPNPRILSLVIALPIGEQHKPRRGACHHSRNFPGVETVSAVVPA